MCLALADADAATKKKSRRWSDLDKTQRAELMKQARALCRKRYGALATVYRIDDAVERIWCTTG